MGEQLWNRMLTEPAIPRVHLFAPPALRTIPDRICISPGTAPVEMVNVNEQVYTSDARLPIPAWRPPLEAESLSIWADTAPQMNRAISIVRILEPQSIEAVRQSLAELRLSGCSERELSSHPPVKALLDRINMVATAGGHFLCNGLAVYRSGLATVTFVPDLGAYLGLHVDRFDRLPADQVDSARNRLCINLGDEDRYLLFLNLTVCDMLSHLPTMCEAVKGSNPQTIAYAFMKRYPNYPIIKVRIRPGEAYIAPTENMVHDGSTLDNQGKTYHLTFLGHFAARPLETKSRLGSLTSLPSA